MPRRKSGPKLWWDRKRKSWTIIDGRSRHRTGCGAKDLEGAEAALRSYSEDKYRPAKSEAPPIADIIATYAEEHVKHLVSGKHISYDLEKLTKWWGTKRITDITATSCRAYVTMRNAPACARRELGFLHASMKHWQKEYAPTMHVPSMKLPPKPEPRQDFMTRDEAAKFLKIARRTPHLARFFLIGWYTGTRRTAICGLKWKMVDFESGVLHRRARNAPQTKKRAPPVKLGFRLLAHLRRWHRLDNNPTGPIIHYKGVGMKRLDKSWPRVRKLAKLPAYVTPHVLRHSRATHMLKAGVQPWEVSNALGMNLETLIKHYGHHMPDWQKDAANVR